MDSRIVVGAIVRIAPSATRTIERISSDLVWLRNPVSHELESCEAIQLHTWLIRQEVTIDGQIVG